MSSVIDVNVISLVGECLQLVCREVVIVPEAAIVGGPTGALNPLVRAQIEIVFRRVGDVGIHSGSSLENKNINKLI